MITIPTFNELYNSVKSDLENEFGSAIPIFGKIFLRALAAVQAGKLKIFYLAQGKLQKNIFVDTADPEDTGGTLDRFARVKLGRNRYPAQAGQYIINVTGTAGGVIPAQTTFKSNDSSLNPGILYVLDNAYIMPGATGQITVRALTAGTGGKLASGNGLTATSPIAQVNKGATVDSETVQPLDAEDIEAYRQAAIQAFRLEPNGGAAGDFRLWADDVQGVARVYPYARPAASAEVNLYVEATAEDSIDGFGTPSALMLSQVEAVVELDPDTTKPINERGRRPLGIWQVHYLPVTINSVDIDIAGFQGLTVDIQTVIQNSLESLVKDIRPFVAGADVLESKNDILDQNKIISAILSVRPGSVFGAITLKIDGVTKLTNTFINGDIPHLNSVTYS
jgi:uncharacterized phage protein gp47/JayE